MPRKRKSDESIAATESATTTALVDLDHTIPIEQNGENPGFAERVGRTNERVAAPDPYKIAGDYGAGVHLFEVHPTF